MRTRTCRTCTTVTRTEAVRALPGPNEASHASTSPHRRCTADTRAWARRRRPFEGATYHRR